MNEFSNLSPKIKKHILLFVPLNSILNYLLISKSFFQLSNSKNFWSSTIFRYCCCINVNKSSFNIINPNWRKVIRNFCKLSGKEYRISSLYSLDFIPIKVVLLGTYVSKIGKSSLMTRFISNLFREEYKYTFGIEIESKVIYDFKSNRWINFQVWDTPSLKKCMLNLNDNYKYCKGIVLCFDLNNEKSFLGIEDRLKEAKKFCNKNVDLVVCLCGCKSDEERKVKNEDINKFKEKWSVKYFETSSKINGNVMEMFKWMVNLIVEKRCKKEEVMRMRVEEKKMRGRRKEEEGKIKFSSLKMVKNKIKIGFNKAKKKAKESDDCCVQ